MTRTKIARGIYRDQYGHEVRWMDGRERSKRFPLDAPLDELKAFRARMQKQVANLRAVTAPASFPRDVVKFLQPRKGRACYKSDRAHLRPWVQRFRRRSRFEITMADVQAAVDQWAVRYSAREIRHRVRLLGQLFRAFDPSRPTPCDHVRLPTISKRKRLPVLPSTIRTVAANLLAHEQKAGGTRLRSARTRARFLILALSGQRPIQLMRTKVVRDVDLQARLWRVPPAKRDDGTIVVLNDQLVAAWQLFIACGAEGKYDTRSFSKTLKRNGWPQDVAPYALRRSVAQRLRDAGVELGDVRDHLGHASDVTTRTFYADLSVPRLEAVSAKLDGLFLEPAVLELPEIATRTASEEKAKARQKTPHYARSGRQPRTGHREGDRAKTA